MYWRPSHPPSYHISWFHMSVSDSPLGSISSFPRQCMFQTVLEGPLSPVSLSTDISAPWFQSNYTGINDDSPRMHFSPLSLSAHQEQDPGHSNHSLLLCRGGVWISQKFTSKDKKTFFPPWFESNYIRITLAECTPPPPLSVRLTGTGPRAQQSLAGALQEWLTIFQKFACYTTFFFPFAFNFLNLYLYRSCG